MGHDANTTIHLAESLGGVRYRCRTHSLVLEQGDVHRVDYGEINHCCQNFNLVDGWLDAGQLQRKGVVGYAEARLARSRDIVRVVTAEIAENETVFLHPVGIDEECDEAWESMETRG